MNGRLANGRSVARARLRLQKITKGDVGAVLSKVRTPQLPPHLHAYALASQKTTAQISEENRSMPEQLTPDPTPYIPELSPGNVVTSAVRRDSNDSQRGRIRVMNV